MYVAMFSQFYELHNCLHYFLSYSKQYVTMTAYYNYEFFFSICIAQKDNNHLALKAGFTGDVLYD